MSITTTITRWQRTLFLRLNAQTDALKLVFENGAILQEQTFDAIRLRTVAVAT